MQAYRAGTRYGVRVGSDGLLSAGEGDDACCRADVNALWFHALVATAQLARLAGRKESGAFYLAWAREHQGRALERLWDEQRGCLVEALTPVGPRRGLSPSQLLAASLSPPLLPPDHAARLLKTVERELFTPLGLRPAAGAATVSPAWLGPFITAHLRVHQRSAEAQARAHGWLEELRASLDERSAIHVPESFAAPRMGDAAARRTAAAPAAHASVLAAAELLRVWIEEMDHAETPAGVT
jgi:glycogen debranching enzyme